jgi:hypothetical protein
MTHERGSGLSTLSWDPPTDSGGTLPVVYDLLRASDPADWIGSAVCLESDDGADTSASDGESPPLGAVRYYLLRIENSCVAGDGGLGRDSDGAERLGAECP